MDNLTDSQQLMSHGLVVGFVPNNPDMAILSNGIHQIYAYNSGRRSSVLMGKTYQIYKQHNMYYIGPEIKSS